MTSNPHTLSAFDQERKQLHERIALMGNLARQALHAAVECLLAHDVDGALQIVARDKELDEMANAVEEFALTLLALRSPVADDLREVVASIKIASALERVGDHAKSTAKRVPLLQSMDDMQAAAALREMSKAAEDLLRDAIDAFVDRDAAKASAVWASDRVVDDYYNSVSNALLANLVANPSTGQSTAHLLFVAKNIERIGDYATNIAEMVYYASEGKRLGDRVRGADPLDSD
ncbi:phosphate signaling complex protein PhoU [Novosphingobium sp. ZN18A2]|uniref:phosphate signaling complex protein PhoU n=1 Tax=Novosphingobium sp. ZN18A2 TaxID=3079861 RepID=UPI0030D23B17